MGYSVTGFYRARKACNAHTLRASCEHHTHIASMLQAFTLACFGHPVSTVIRGSCVYVASIIICSEHIACALGSKYTCARTLYAHKCELAVRTLHIRGLHAAHS